MWGDHRILQIKWFFPVTNSTSFVLYLTVVLRISLNCSGYCFSFSHPWKYTSNDAESYVLLAKAEDGLISLTTLEHSVVTKASQNVRGVEGGRETERRKQRMPTMTIRNKKKMKGVRECVYVCAFVWRRNCVCAYLRMCVSVSVWMFGPLLKYVVCMCLCVCVYVRILGRYGCYNHSRKREIGSSRVRRRASGREREREWEWERERERRNNLEMEWLGLRRMLKYTGLSRVRCLCFMMRKKWNER